MGYTQKKIIYHTEKPKKDRTGNYPIKQNTPDYGKENTILPLRQNLYLK